MTSFPSVIVYSNAKLCKNTKTTNKKHFFLQTNVKKIAKQTLMPHISLLLLPLLSACKHDQNPYTLLYNSGSEPTVHYLFSFFHSFAVAPLSFSRCKVTTFPLIPQYISPRLNRVFPRSIETHSPKC